MAALPEEAERLAKGDTEAAELPKRGGREVKGNMSLPMIDCKSVIFTLNCSN